MKSFLILCLLYSQCLLLAVSCGSEPGQKPKAYTQEELLELNRANIKGESTVITKYIEQQEWEMAESPTGLRYDIYYDAPGATAATDQQVFISYRAILLDSSNVASATASAPLIFQVGRANVVSGLHEAVKLLSPGDSARFILPSHLAYGLTGDVNIPGNAPIVYDVEMLKIQ